MVDAVQKVKLTIDGIAIEVSQGSNLVEAAEAAGVEIPHYCYHSHLSVAGNCRMCQVQVEGMPKLTIACNTMAKDGMVVKTHRTSPEVAEAQRATLEFLLINHPLDCTVCDQSGHCKLQDYYYEYNGEASRFIEEKEHKVKAEKFGPEVIYDGERCITCTRCVRFCREVTKTSELGVFNRGDESVIGVFPGHELKNELSGTVVDLCPVGALTHRRWRFNTRIWYTSEHDSICPGCSTGCNVKVAIRDNQVLCVKARKNSSVNKEWMCDEGRYGFSRFQPENRLLSPLVNGEKREFIQALSETLALSSGDLSAAVFLSPFLTLEEGWLALRYAREVMNTDKISMQCRRRELSDVASVLVSPDYAPNARALEVFGIGSSGDDWRASLEARYDALLSEVREGKIGRLLLVGDQAILREDADEALKKGISQCEISVCLGVAEEGALEMCKVCLPARTVNEKNGVMLNRDLRAQRLRALLEPPAETYAEWHLLEQMADAAEKPFLGADVVDERAVFLRMVKQCSELGALSLMRIADKGMTIK